MQASQTDHSSYQPTCAICAKLLCQVRIHCAEKDICADYDLCVQCFASGSSSKNHVPSTHKYHVIEQHSIPVYVPDWGADEELLLLEGAETYGLGSWADIADHIGGYRGKDEVRDHYIDTYVNSPNFPLPALADPGDMRLLEEMPREVFQANKKRRIEERKEKAKNAPPAPPKQKPTASVPACHEVQGYMPGRLEFETEFNNEAEEAVQHMQFEPGDGLNPRTGELEPEMELKMAVMDIYNSKLTARAFRKRAIFEHRLLEYRKNAAIDKKRTKEERDLANKVKPFAKIMNHDEWEAFSAGILEEHHYRNAIVALQDWRAKGICDLKTGATYEHEKAARLARPALTGQFDRMPGVRPPKVAPPIEVPAQQTALVAHELPRDLQERQKPESYHRMMEKKRKEEAAFGSTATTNGSNGVNFNGGSHVSNPLTNGNANASANNPITITSSISAPLKSEPRATYSPSPVQGIAPRKLGPDTADLQLLTDEESQLCSVIRCTPKAYLAMKDALLKEAIKAGGMLKRRSVREIVKVRVSVLRCERRNERQFRMVRPGQAMSSGLLRVYMLTFVPHRSIRLRRAACSNS
jgi:transcriptional adapter 2-alpha